MLHTCSFKPLGKLMQENHLSPGVWGQPEQHSKTLSQKIILKRKNFWGTYKLYIKAVVPFYSPISNVWGFQFFYSVTNTDYCLSFLLYPHSGSVVVAHHVFLFAFPWWLLEYLFSVYWPFACFWKKYIFKSSVCLDSCFIFMSRILAFWPCPFSPLQRLSIITVTGFF